MVQFIIGHGHKHKDKRAPKKDKYYECSKTCWIKHQMQKPKKKKNVISGFVIASKSLVDIKLYK